MLKYSFLKTPNLNIILLPLVNLSLKYSPLKSIFEDIQVKYAATFTIIPVRKRPCSTASLLLMQALTHPATNFVHHPHLRLADFFFRLLTEAAQSYFIIPIYPFTYLLIKKR